MTRRELMVLLYRSQYSMAMIAKVLHTSTAVVSFNLHQAGVPMRGNSRIVPQVVRTKSGTYEWTNRAACMEGWPQ